MPGPRDLSVSLSTADLISPLSAEGVASFICLHNCRPACLCVWRVAVKSAALLLFPRRKEASLKQLHSFAPSLLAFTAFPSAQIRPINAHAHSALRDSRAVFSFSFSFFSFVRATPSDSAAFPSRSHVTAGVASECSLP